MTGCFNSAYSAIIQEKWMLFAYFYYVQSSFIKLDSLFLGFLFLIVIAVKELFPVVFRFGASFFNVATFRMIGMSRIDEIEYEAPLADGSGKTAKVKIVPLQFLKAVLDRKSVV